MALGDVRTQIEVIDFERAIHLLERTEVKMRLAYIMSGGNKLTPYIHQVLNMLDKNKGRMPMFEIVQLLYHELDIEDVKKLISTMEDMHAVKKVITEDGKWLVKT
jgi:UDP-galactopyranose mutase